MTDNEIIKALECCSENQHRYCRRECMKEALDLINRQKAEIERLTYVLMGVMHSVDKWLDGDELKQDEVNRAANMREKTLRIVDGKQAEINRLNKEVDRLSQLMLYNDGITDMTVSEAIRLFAERLKEKKQEVLTSVNISEYAVTESNINNLVKEMS